MDIQAMRIRVSHVGLCVADLERSLRFYRDGLGFRETERYESGPEVGSALELNDVSHLGVFLERDGTTVELLHFKSPVAIGPSDRRTMNQLGLTHLNFEVDDIDRAKERLIEFGGSIDDSTRVRSAENGYEVLFCTDPDGIRIEFSRYFPPTSPER